MTRLLEFVIRFLIVNNVNMPVQEYKKIIQIIQRGEREAARAKKEMVEACLLYTSPSPRDGLLSRMPSSA